MPIPALNVFQLFITSLEDNAYHLTALIAKTAILPIMSAATAPPPTTSTTEDAYLSALTDIMETTPLTNAQHAWPIVIYVSAPQTALNVRLATYLFQPRAPARTRAMLILEPLATCPGLLLTLLKLWPLSMCLLVQDLSLLVHLSIPMV